MKHYFIKILVLTCILNTGISFARDCKDCWGLCKDEPYTSKDECRQKSKKVNDCFNNCRWD